MDPENEAVGRRMRAAREAAELSLDKASQRLGVAKSTIQRWESGELKARDHWDKIEKIYGRSRLELEFGVAPNGRGIGEPPYPSWREFLAWLEDAHERLHVQPWMLDQLRSLRLPDDREMTADGYRVLLHGMLGMPTKARAV